MQETLRLFGEYMPRIIPGFVLIAGLFFIMKPKKHMRVILYILSFLILRDVMTPLGLWFPGATRGVFWIRLIEDPLFLVFFGFSSLILVTGLFLCDKENRQYVHWFKNTRVAGVLSGIGGCILVVLPVVIAYQFIDIEQRGGTVAFSLIGPLLVFAMGGNLFEELLFRGYAMGLVKTDKGFLYKGVLSGVLFAVCHIFLATTVTNLGIPLLVFVLWEGIIAGIVGARYGIIPSTLTHGGAVFILASGLV